MPSAVLFLVEYDEGRARVRSLTTTSDLEHARGAHKIDQLGRRSDDISRQLFFHFNSFSGIDRRSRPFSTRRSKGSKRKSAEA